MEDQTLLGSSGRRGIALYVWWGINIAILVFVFLAFLMSTLSYAHGKDFANQVNNSFVTQQGGLIQQTYKVAPAFQTAKGSVVSFCGNGNQQICEGLGPEWQRPFFSSDSAVPDIFASLAQLSPSVGIYTHVTEDDHLTLRVTVVNTGPDPSVWSTTRLTLSSPVTSIHARATSNPTVVAIMYTTHNETFLIGGVVTTTPNSGTVALGTPIDLFSIHDPTQNGTLVRNLATAGDWVLVTAGYIQESAIYRAYVVDVNSPTKLVSKPITTTGYGFPVFDVIATTYLQNGYIMQSTASRLVLGKIDFNANTISPVATADFFVVFHSLVLTPLETGFVIFSGAQVLFVDTPRAVSMIVQWRTTTPFLTVNFPTNLLGTQQHELMFDQVSVCYLPASPQEPYGGIFYSYVDARSRMAKVFRARPVPFGNTLHLLPSPSLDISTYQYGKYNSWLSPHLVCPVGVSTQHVLVVVQDFRAYFNTFTWAGGYRYAGVAQVANVAGKDVDVVRQGISSGHVDLVPGFQYFAYNNGTLAPFTSISETFTPNGFPFAIGTALTDKLLHLEGEIFDFAE
jgi:hypothetical protein